VALCEHHNWIGGAWRAAQGERYYVRRAPAVETERGDFETLDHRWPEASADDVRGAVEAAAVSAQRWLARPREQRWSALYELAEALTREVDVAAIADDLGLEPHEYAPHAAEHELRLFEGLELYREGPSSQGVSAFGAHWSDGAAALLARAAPRLIAGETLVVWADPRAPHAAEALARGLETSTFPSGVVNVLHGASREGRDALLGTPGLAGVRWKAPQSDLESLAERFRARLNAGWEFWRCANTSVVVCERDNLDEVSAELVERAFSRAATLSGQHPGQVARVLCHQRLYSRLCEQLRRRLGADPDLERPVPALDDDLERHVLECWAQGMDEGATPICGEPPTARERSRAEGVGGLVFVNVDPSGALCRSSRPAPVLSLVRVASDEEGRELRAQLDLGPRWSPDSLPT
jgi:acyl-CoA reductase-like NAD-dependent aldehyde dehydrogenase